MCWSEKYQLTITRNQIWYAPVLFTAFFDLIFINIYKPFSSLTWYPVSEFKFFIFSSLVILYRSTCRGDQSCDYVFLHEETYTTI